MMFSIRNNIRANNSNRNINKLKLEEMNKDDIVYIRVRFLIARKRRLD